MIPTLTTERLVLRPLALTDAPALQAEFPRWEIVRHLAARVPWPYPDDGAESFLRDLALPATRAGTEWHWSLRPKVEPERLIGVISLMAEPDHNRGFWLVPEWQGQGLATEASVAVTDFWFDELGQKVLRVPKAVKNVPSRRISERSGMRVISTDEREYVSGRKLTELWEITSEEWQALRRGWPKP